MDDLVEQLSGMIRSKVRFLRRKDTEEKEEQQKDKRWSLHDEMSKPFKASLYGCFPDFTGEADLFPNYEKEPGDFNCTNVLTIWPKLRNNDVLRDQYPHIEGPRDVGNAIMNNLPDSAIEMLGCPSVLDVGFVTFSLSPKWMARMIHRMLKKGIQTWAPKLPVEKVLVKYPSLDEEIHMGLFQRSVIAETLVRMLNYSKVDATITPTIEKDDSPLDILKKWFLIEERMRKHLVIRVDDKPPFILAKKDLNLIYNDLEALRHGFKEESADWIVYVTPVRKQEYIEMCFTAAKLEKWTPTNSKWKWIPDGTSYVGYGTSNAESKELASFLNKVEEVCKKKEIVKDAQLLEYNVEAVIYAFVTYTFLKTHRLANCTITLDEMVVEEENTFLYLLKTRAKIRKITDDRREDINKLKKASKLIVEKNKQWGELKERVLEVHLLEFTKAIKESCSYLSPHILCEYLYGLSKKFTNYHPRVSKAGSVGLLLCEATAIVMDKCFLILGVTPHDFAMHDDYKIHFQSEDANAPVEAGVDSGIESEVESDKKTKQKARLILEEELVDGCVTPCLVSVAKDPPRNSRLEVFSIRPFVTTAPHIRTGNMFGFIAVSDKYGVISDGVSHLFEPDFAYVPLFNREWSHSISIHNGEYIYLGNPSSRHSVAFSSSIEISMEIYVTSEKNVFELCSRKFKLDLLNIWGKNADNQCSSIDIKGEDGNTEMHFMLIKDAVDAAVEIRYATETIADEAGGCKIRGQIYAYYGSDILDHCRAHMRPCYWALLFRSDVLFSLEGEIIPLRKSVMAVPKGAPLIISAYLYDGISGEVIMDGICELKSQTEGSSKGVIEGLDEETRCSLSLKVDWTYEEAQYL